MPLLKAAVANSENHIKADIADVGGDEKSKSAKWQRDRYEPFQVRCLNSKLFFVRHSPSPSRSPHSASIRPPHLLPRLATEGLGELGHIRNHIVDAEDGQRVRVSSNDHPCHLRTYRRAPRVRIGKKKTLPIGPAIRTFVIE